MARNERGPHITRFGQRPGGGFVLEGAIAVKASSSSSCAVGEVWALRRAIDPERYADKRRRSDQRRQGDAAELFRQSQSQARWAGDPGTGETDRDERRFLI